MLTGHPSNPLLQPRRPVDHHTGAALISDRRIGPIGGQHQALRHPAQHILPVGQLRGDGAVAIGQITKLRALPQRVIDILHRQRRPGEFYAPHPAGISHPQITHQRGHRPAISGDMVHHGHQHVFILGDTEKLCPQRDLGCQIKPVTRPPASMASPSRLTDQPVASTTSHPKSARSTGITTCWGIPPGRRKQRAQALMAAHHIGQRRTQRLGIKAPAQPQRHRHVVNR